MKAIKRLLIAFRLVFHKSSYAVFLVDKTGHSSVIVSDAPDADKYDKLIWWCKQLRWSLGPEDNRKHDQIV